MITLLRLGLIGALLVGAIPAMAQEDDDKDLDPVEICQAAVEGLHDLTANLSVPELFDTEQPTITANDFDVNAYFDVLDHLKMAEGYRLSYVYMFNMMGSRPFLYTYPEDEAPFGDFDAFRATWEDNRSPDYLAHVVPDDAAGYLQLVALAVMGEQFYLTWHANYNDLRILCDAADLEALLDTGDGFGGMFPDDVVAEARALDVEPVVDLDGEQASVQVLTYTDWGGFSRLTLTVNRDDPQDQTWSSDQLVPYDCGVMF